MNKQIAIIAIGFVAIGFIVSANVVPRALAQSDSFEQLVKSLPSTNATGSKKPSVYIMACPPNMPQGKDVKLESYCSIKRLIP